MSDELSPNELDAIKVALRSELLRCRDADFSKVLESAYAKLQLASHVVAQRDRDLAIGLLGSPAEKLAAEIASGALPAGSIFRKL